MVKKDEQKAKSNGSGKSRMRVSVAGFDMEGSDDVMAEGFKAIRELSASISRSTILPPALTGKPALNAPKPEAGGTVEADEVEQPVAIEVADVEVDDADEEGSNGNGSGQKRSYNFKPPKFMDDLDFSTASKSLEDFMTEKGNPTEMMDKYLVTIVWFKDYVNIEEVTVNHIYTAFDHAEWKSELPVKPSKPLSDLKSKRHVLTREPGAEGYKLNFKGIQYVEKMGK